MPDLIGMDLRKGSARILPPPSKRPASVLSAAIIAGPASRLRAALTLQAKPRRSADAGSVRSVALWRMDIERASSNLYPIMTRQIGPGQQLRYRQAMTTHQPAGDARCTYAARRPTSIRTRSPVRSTITFIGVVDAFEAIGRGNSAYLVGVYGSGLSCSWLLNHDRAQRSWLSGSSGWSGYEQIRRLGHPPGI